MAAVEQRNKSSNPARGRRRAHAIASAAAAAATIRLAAVSMPCSCAQFDGGIDLGRKSKVVGRDDEVIQSATSRSRKNLKNSIPSRRRRFIIAGLRTISPTIEAIFGARK
jgi:hypothetical protein